MTSERLQKILAQAGIASRRAAEKYITEGRVRVNGEVVSELGAKADPSEDTIEIDGLGVIEPEPIVYIALHKPIHVVTTVSDPEKRQTVIDVMQMSRAEGRKTFEGNMPRIFPVGRLDFDAEGLLILTNDGALANDLLHPRYHVPKTYVVKVRGRPDDRQVDRLRRGVRLREEDGSMSRPTAKADVNVVRESPSNTWLEMVIVEGRHHQVKRMCESVGHQVIRLIRTEFGGIELGELEPGQWRFLSEGEVELLRSWRAGNASELLAAREGPSMTERLFGAAKGGRGKRSGAPRERVYRADRTEGEGARGRRDGAPRAAGRGERGVSARGEFAGRGERPSRGPRGDSPRGEFAGRGERASRGPRPGGGGRGDSRGAPRGRRDETSAARDGGSASYGAPRPARGGAGRGRDAADSPRSGGPGRGAPRGRPVSPRGDSAERRPRGKFGEGRGMSPRGDSAREGRPDRSPRGNFDRAPRGEGEGRPARSFDGPRGDRAGAPRRGPSGPRGDRGDAPRRGPGGPRSDRGDAPRRSTGGPRGDRGDAPRRSPSGPRGDRGDAPRRGPGGPRGDRSDAPRRGPGGPRGDRGDAPRRGPGGPRGDRGEGRPQRGFGFGPRRDSASRGDRDSAPREGNHDFDPRGERHGSRGPRSAPHSGAAGQRRGGPGRHH